MWIRAIPHRSGSIDSARAVDGSTYYKYIAGIVHISTQLGNSTRLTFHEHEGNDAADERATWAQNGGAKNESNINDIMAYLRQQG